jgi:hypothetical protein
MIVSYSRTISAVLGDRNRSSGLALHRYHLFHEADRREGKEKEMTLLIWMGVAIVTIPFLVFVGMLAYVGWQFMRSWDRYWGW